jgi:hypothetical protein
MKTYTAEMVKMYLTVFISISFLVGLGTGYYVLPQPKPANPWKVYNECLDEYRGPSGNIGITWDDMIKCHNAAVNYELLMELTK